MLLHKDKTNHDLPIKTSVRVHFCLKKAQLISNKSDCENMKHLYAFLAEVIKI